MGALFLSRATFVGAPGGLPGSPESVTSMPLPLAAVTLFFWTTTSPLRAPTKIAETSSGNAGSPTRARTALASTRTRELAKNAAKVLSSTLLFRSTSTSCWRMPVVLSAKKMPAPLWRSNRFQVMATSRAPSSEKTPKPPVANSLLAIERLRQTRVGCSPLEPRWRPTPLSLKMVSRTR